MIWEVGALDSNSVVSCIFKIFIYLFWLCWVLVAACMRDLVPQPGVEPGPLALGVRSLTHWTTREAPVISFCVCLTKAFPCVTLLEITTLSPQP